MQLSPYQMPLLIFTSSLTDSNRDKLLFNLTKCLNGCGLCTITDATLRPNVILAECSMT